MNSTKPFKGQKYSSLKKDLIKKGDLFIDPEFPPNNKSLFFSKVDNEIEWKRPKDMCKVPKLVVEGVSCDDLNEGELGNAWFVTACSSLAQDQRLWSKVIPNHKEQEWRQDAEYAGIFHFQFWRYGEFIDVVIDDLLPTKNGKLVFCHSHSRNEFWSALLEKAYAKLYGDYESLTSGYAADALVDFTGGVAERMENKSFAVEDNEGREKLFQALLQASDSKALMIATKECAPSEVGQESDRGLVKGHGYGITGVLGIAVPKQLTQAVGSEKLQLLRLRNPWGTREWTGPWSDNSSEWTALTVRDRESLGIKFSQEGEFWMAVNDFVDQFSSVDICHFVNTSIFTIRKTWSESLLHGEWTQGARGSLKDRAGGSPDNRTHLMNPQFVFDVAGVVDSVMISLEQRDVTAAKQIGQKLLRIGFQIFKVEVNRTYRIHHVAESVAISDFITRRSVFSKLTLKRGRYVIIPCTFTPGEIGHFLLRLYSGASYGANNENDDNLVLEQIKRKYITFRVSRELALDCPPPPGCFGKGHLMVTRVVIVGADDLPKKPQMNSYVTVKCEGETVKSDPIKNKENPQWNFQAIFYRKKPDENINIEILNSKNISSELLGLAVLSETGTTEGKKVQLDLFGKAKKEQSVQRPGKLTVQVFSDHDLTAL